MRSMPEGLLQSHGTTPQSPIGDSSPCTGEPTPHLHFPVTAAFRKFLLTCFRACATMELTIQLFRENAKKESRMTHTYQRITAALTALALSLSLLLPAAAETAAAADAAAETAASAPASAEPAAEPAAEAAAPVYPNTLGAFGSITNLTETPLGGAATLTRYENRAPGAAVQTAFAVTASPTSGARIAAVNLGAGLHSREKLSSLTQAAAVAGETLTAAVNADFFSLYTGVPMGVLVADGRLLSTSDGRDAVGFDKDGGAIFGKVSETVTLETDTVSLPVNHVNKYPGVYGAYLLTRDYGETTTQKGYAATEYVLKLDGDLTLGGAVRATVTAVRAAEENGEIPADSAVLVVPDAFATAADYAVLTPDTTLTVRVACESGFEHAVSALGGGDVILRDGKAVDGVVNEEHEKTRQPRTALGVKADGSYLLFVADGRRTGYASGLTLTALADTLSALGCTDAVNFDGGGSTALVTFAGGTATVQNRPSDGSERKVANAAALYEKDEVAAAAPRLVLAQDAPLLLAGAAYTVAWTVENGAGETLAHTLTAENTTLTVPDALGQAELRDGAIVFTPAAVTGGGILTVETRVGDETLRASCYLRVTDTVDELRTAETLLLAPAEGTVTLTLHAYKDGEEVYFGDLAAVRCENDAIGSAQCGNVFAFAVGTAALPGDDTDETDKTDEIDQTNETEPAAPVRGRVAFTLLDRTLVLPALFGEPTSPLKLDGLLQSGAAVAGGDYTLTYETAGGIAAGGAFVLTPRVLPAETTAETAESTADSTAESVEPTAETAEPAETTAASAETTAPAETTDLAETTESEPIEEPAPTPVSVTLTVSGLSSAGLAGRRLWLWADGISAAETPYAVFTLTHADGTEETLTVPYDAYYDFADYNGRALLTLVPEAADGVLTLRTLLGFAVTDPTRTVAIGPLLLTEQYDTNRYADLADHWSSYFVNALSFAGVVSGSEDETGKVVYNPDANLSREQFAKILCGVLNLDTAAYADTALPFDDTASVAAWALPYVRTVFGAGLMRGKDTPDGRLLFAPGDAITREEAFYVLGGLFESDAAADTADFADADTIAPWAAAMLQKSVAAGLVSGYDDGTVRPKGRITRAETATVVVRLLGRLYRTVAKD